MENLILLLAVCFTRRRDAEGLRDKQLEVDSVIQFTKGMWGRDLLYGEKAFRAFQVVIYECIDEVGSLHLGWGIGDRSERAGMQGVQGLGCRDRGIGGAWPLFVSFKNGSECSF